MVARIFLNGFNAGRGFAKRGARAVESELVRIAVAVRDAVAKAPHEKWGATVGMGADGTPTKWIDEVAETVLLEQVKTSDIDANILSEEAGLVELDGKNLLVADPVDGTHNAARGIPFYCVSLALARDRLNDVSEGVVVNAANGDVYHARKGRGATLNGQTIQVRPWKEHNDTVSIYMGPEAPEAAFESHSRGRRRQVREQNRGAVLISVW